MYYVGLPIPGTSDPDLHLTVCVLRVSRWCGVVLDEIKALAVTVLPLDIDFGAMARFGRNHDLPVRMITIRDPTKKQCLDAFYAANFVPFPGEEGRLTQAFHVTTNKISATEAAQLMHVSLGSMFVKTVGGGGKIIWNSDT
jgi:hypothetical protein